MCRAVGRISRRRNPPRNESSVSMCILMPNYRVISASADDHAAVPENPLRRALVAAGAADYASG